MAQEERNTGEYMGTLHTLYMCLPDAISQRNVLHTALWVLKLFCIPLGSSSHCVQRAQRSCCRSGCSALSVLCCLVWTLPRAKGTEYVKKRREGEKDDCFIQQIHVQVLPRDSLCILTAVLSFAIMLKRKGVSLFQIRQFTTLTRQID